MGGPGVNLTGTTNPLAWTPQTLSFTSNAVGGSVLLKFTAFGDLTHVFLDNVVVERMVVPEPGVAGLLLAGTVGLGVVRRLHRGGGRGIA